MWRKVDDPRLSRLPSRQPQPELSVLAPAEYVQRAVEMAPRGSQLAKKLTVDDVRAMRANVNGRTGRQQAIVFGVSVSMVYKIRRGERWGVVR